MKRFFLRGCVAGARAARDRARGLAGADAHARHRLRAAVGPRARRLRGRQREPGRASRTFGGRIYAVGQTTARAARRRIAILARRSNGTYETGFGSGGKLMLPIPGTETGSARDVAVLPDGRLRIVAVVDVDLGTSTDNDIALIGLLPDGSLRPDVRRRRRRRDLRLRRRLDDQPTRMALDAARADRHLRARRQDGQLDDTLVALRAPDGSATGVRRRRHGQLDLAPGRRSPTSRPTSPSGREAASSRSSSVETNPGSATDYIASLRGFTRGRLARDATSARAARPALAVGEPDTNATALLERRGMFWVTGSTKDGVQTDGFLARVDGTATACSSGASTSAATSTPPRPSAPARTRSRCCRGARDAGRGRQRRATARARRSAPRPSTTSTATSRACRPATSSSAPPAWRTRSSAPPPTATARSAFARPLDRLLAGLELHLGAAASSTPTRSATSRSTCPRRWRSPTAARRRRRSR